MIWCIVFMIGFLKSIFFWHSITKKQCKEFMCYTKKAEWEDPGEQIVQYDKIYHHILKSLGYRWSFGEILKRNPKEIKNINDVWELHKLRNRLVHDLKQPNVDIEGYSRKYKKVIEKFLKQVTR